MTLQVLLSCMHQKDEKLIDILRITGDAVIVNQCDNENDQTIVEGNRKIRMISTTERGLSKSRNMAIRNAEADICIICDNDIVYCEDYERIICSAYEKNPDADICVFFIKRPERSQPVLSSEKELGYLTAMKIFSPEISFKRESLKKLKFNEYFGAGAEYGMGEENIFLWEAKKQGLKVVYIPIEIAHTMPNESTWFMGYTDKFFENRGAGYYQMSHGLWWLLALQFAIRKNKIYKKDNSIINAMKCMCRGKREYAAKVKA